MPCTSVTFIQLQHSLTEDNPRVSGEGHWHDTGTAERRICFVWKKGRQGMFRATNGTYTALSIIGEDQSQEDRGLGLSLNTRLSLTAVL